MTAPVLYFDNATIHDSWTRPGDFASTLSSIEPAKRPSVIVAVTQSTFSRLDRIVAYAFSRTLTPAPLIPKFEPRKETKLFDGFRNYLELVNTRLKGSPVNLAQPDPALLGIMADFDRGATDRTRSNLLRLLGVLADDVFIGPHTFHLDISNRCNTNCIFCGLHSPMLIDPKKKIRGRRFTEGWKGHLIDEKIFCDLVDDLAEIGCREDILFSGEGEPLTHPDADRMIRYVRSKDMALTLFTNGLAVDKAKADLFVQSDLDILYWSLSAGTAKTFAALQPARKATEYGRMIEAMRYLVEKKRKKNNKPYIILAHVINSKNFDECEKMMALAKDVGIDSVRYQVMHSCSSTEPLLISKEQFDVASGQLDKARLQAEKAGIEIVANIDFQMESAAKTYELPETVLPCHWSFDLYNRTGCLAGWFFSRSFTDGRISFCCHDKIVGSLYRARFRDLWYSDRYRQIRQSAKAFKIDCNIDMTDESCGGWLLDEDCNYCGNYEFINQALVDLENLGWKKYLRRDI